jgi:hypothetical protein
VSNSCGIYEDIKRFLTGIMQKLKFFHNCKSSPHFWLPSSTVNVKHYFFQNVLGYLHFGYFFNKTHLVTLPACNPCLMTAFGASETSCMVTQKAFNSKSKHPNWFATRAIIDVWKQFILLYIMPMFCSDKYKNLGAGLPDGMFSNQKSQFG